MIEESGKRTPATIPLVNDSDYWSSLEPMVDKATVFQKEDEWVKKLNYQKAIDTYGTPCILIFTKKTEKNQKPTKVYEGRLPSSQKEMTAIVKQLTGK